MIISELGNDPFSFAQLPKLDVAGSSPVARSVLRINPYMGLRQWSPPCLQSVAFSLGATRAELHEECGRHRLRHSEARRDPYFQVSRRASRAPWRTLTKELLVAGLFESRAIPNRELFRLIEIWYNRQRWHSWLGYQSPAQYEAELLRVS